MTDNATQLRAATPAEAELLTCLAEECGEVVQRCTKILRFGFDSVGPRTTIDNRGLLEGELGDLVAIADALTRLGALSGDHLFWHTQAKFQKMLADRKLFVHAGDALRAWREQLEPQLCDADTPATVMLAEIARLNGQVEQVTATLAENAHLAAEVEHWKKRAVQHGCDVERGDPECG